METLNINLGLDRNAVSLKEFVYKNITLYYGTDEFLVTLLFSN